MLGDIERLVRTAGQRVMKRFTQDLVEAEAEVEETNTCPECGQKMRYKGQKARHSALVQWRAVSNNSKAVLLDPVCAGRVNLLKRCLSSAEP